MSDASAAAQFVLKNEDSGYLSGGTYVCDTGGPTKFGITAKYLMQKKLWRYDFDGDGVIDSEDMKLFSLSDAINVYTDMFYEGNYNKLSNNDLSTRVFDFAVNSGDHQSVKTLQLSYNAEVFKSNWIAEDGILGSATIERCNNYFGTDKILENFKTFRAFYYKSLVKRNSEKYGKYLNGWLKRAAL